MKRGNGFTGRIRPHHDPAQYAAKWRRQPSPLLLLACPAKKKKLGDEELVERLKQISARDVELKEERDREKAMLEAQKSGVERQFDKVEKVISGGEKDSNGFVKIGGLVASLLTVWVYVGNQGMSGYTAARKLDFREPQQEITERDRQQARELLGQMEARRQNSPRDLEALEASAVLYTKLGNYPKVEAETGKYQDALDSYEKALNIDSGLLLSMVLVLALARHDAFAMNAGSLEIWEGYTNVFITEGDYEEALEQLEQAKALQPQEIGILKAAVYAQWPGHLRDAEKIYTKLIEDYPEDARVYLAKGAFLNKAERYFEANKVIAEGKQMMAALEAERQQK
eukprot:jgi/Bigna1/144216/aug1.85_g18924